MLARLLFLAGCVSALLLPAGLVQAQHPAPVAVHGLRGQYYAGTKFEKLVLTRTDKTIDFDWSRGPATNGYPGEYFVPPGPGVPSEWFSARWTGFIYVPATGSYTFEIATDDGMRVWVGGRRILNSWANQATTRVSTQLKLAAGRYYSVRVEYYQADRATRALLAWKPPGAAAEAPARPIPASNLYAALPATARPVVPELTTYGPPPPGTTVKTNDVETQPTAVTVPGRLPRGIGLQATYYAGSVRGAAAHSRIEPVVNVTWKGAAPAPGVAGQGFSVRWTGYIYAPESGLYVLHTEWDDAIDIRFGGHDVLTMEKYEPEYFRPDKPPIKVDMVYRLQAGQLYRIDLSYKNVQGVSRAILSWARPSALGNPATEQEAYTAKYQTKMTVIPRLYLYPELPRPLPEPVAAKLPASPKPTPAARLAAAASVPAPRQEAVPELALPDLRSLSKGDAVALSQLYFTQSTATMLPSSRPLLNSLVQKLQQQPALQLEIAGHTDNVGEPAKNLLLSEQRAKVVRRYLVQQGIDSVRLTARGYGGTRPVADNRDPQQRPRNRRVEIVVR